MKKYTAAQFYLDGLVIQAAFGNDKLVKQAEGGAVDELISAVKSYAGDRFNPDDKVGSIINILAPSALGLMLNALGLRWIAVAATLAMDYFRVDVKSILESIFGSIINAVKTHGVLESNTVSNIVDAAFKPELDKEAYTTRDALLYKFALEEYNINKKAGVLKNIVKGKTITLLAKAVKWIFFTVLASIGVIGINDTISSIIGGPSKSTTTQQKSQVSTHSTQTKFKVKSGADLVLNSSSSTWVEEVPPTDYNIINMVLDWMSDTYDGVESYEEAATHTVGFNEVVKEIKDYNKRNKSNKTYIPRMFTTKKNAVDMFIDDVANKAISAPVMPPKPGIPSLTDKPGSITA